MDSLWVPYGFPMDSLWFYLGPIFGSILDLKNMSKNMSRNRSKNNMFPYLPFPIELSSQGRQVFVSISN